jgi:hypothetical protein
MEITSPPTAIRAAAPPARAASIVHATSDSGRFSIPSSPEPFSAAAARGEGGSVFVRLAARLPRLRLGSANISGGGAGAASAHDEAGLDAVRRDAAGGSHLEPRHAWRRGLGRAGRGARRSQRPSTGGGGGSARHGWRGRGGHRRGHGHRPRRGGAARQTRPSRPPPVAGRGHASLSTDLDTYHAAPSTHRVARAAVRRRRRPGAGARASRGSAPDFAPLGFFFFAAAAIRPALCRRASGEHTARLGHRGAAAPGAEGAPPARRCRSLPSRIS